MQPESPPTVQATAEALERLRVSEDLRSDIPDHDYPRRGEDVEIVERFYGAYGELPPKGYLARVLWWVRGGGG